MKKLVSLLLFLAIALIGFGVIAPDKMPVDGETKDLLYSMNEKGAYIVEGIKKVATDIGVTVKAFSKGTVAKAKDEINQLNEETEIAIKKTEQEIKIAKAKITESIKTLEDNSVKNEEEPKINTYSRADILAFKIHNNPNDDISIDEEIKKARARYNAQNNVSNNAITKKIVTENNSAKKIIREQKENKYVKTPNVINFPFNGSDLTKSALEKLKKIQFNSNSKITIIGHTDNIGSVASNKYFSKARAMAVKKYLVNKGVKEENIKVEFSGASDPKASNSNITGRRANRRVELSISN